MQRKTQKTFTWDNWEERWASEDTDEMRIGLLHAGPSIGWDSQLASDSFSSPIEENLSLQARKFRTYLQIADKSSGFSNKVRIKAFSSTVEYAKTHWKGLDLPIHQAKENWYKLVDDQDKVQDSLLWFLRYSEDEGHLMNFEVLLISRHLSDWFYANIHDWLIIKWEDMARSKKQLPCHPLSVGGPLGGDLFVRAMKKWIFRDNFFVEIDLKKLQERLNLFDADTTTTLKRWCASRNGSYEGSLLSGNSLALFLEGVEVARREAFKT